MLCVCECERERASTRRRKKGSTSSNDTVLLLVIVQKFCRKTVNNTGSTFLSSKGLCEIQDTNNMQQQLTNENLKQ